MGGDHPRSRGVYTLARPCAASRSGSSPLARGLRTVGEANLLLAGIIPARAGFTRSPGRAVSFPGDHPRSRGVYSQAICRHGRVSGSSPLARGLRQERHPMPVRGGIIPARAGFTSRRATLSGHRQDHPRSRGVYRDACCQRGADAGSSPLARGLPSVAGRLARAAGIIPARAGFTATAADSSPHRRDHPRSRGVYRRSAFRIGRAGGSSPLARGLRERSAARCWCSGIIPARAGFTDEAEHQWKIVSDHPRSRGVYTCGSLESQR